MPADGTFGAPKQPNSPRGGEAKKMTKAELDAAVERLNRPPHRKDELAPLHSSKKFSAEEMNSSVDRLYTQTMHTRKAQAEIAEKRAHPDLQKHIKMDEGELDGTFNRLYAVRETQKANLEKLRKQQEERDSPRGKSPRKLNKDDVANSARRLHDESLNKSKEKQDKLFDKYVTSTDVKVAKRTEAELQEAIQRLSTKN